MVDLFDIMKEDGVEPVKIIDCYGDKTDENAHNREKGLQRAIKEYGYENVPIVEAECGHWEPDVCGQNLAPVLAANPDANCMYSSSDFLSSGIQKAMEDAGMWHKHGEEGHVYFSASDLYPLGIQHLREGYMDTGVVLPVLSICSRARKLSRYSWFSVLAPPTKTSKRSLKPFLCGATTTPTINQSAELRTLINL